MTEKQMIIVKTTIKVQDLGEGVDGSLFQKKPKGNSGGKRCALCVTALQMKLQDADASVTVVGAAMASVAAAAAAVRCRSMI